MTFGRYLEGVLFIALAVVPIGAASYLWRKRLLPKWTGAIGRLAEIIMGVSAVIFVSELFGTVSSFRVDALVPSLAMVGAVGSLLGFQRTVPLNELAPVATSEEVVGGSNPLVANLTAIAAVSVVMADWGTRTADAYHHGMTTVDTLWYHMPYAARFVQEASLTPLHYFDAEAATVFFPANSELVHALGIMFLGNDVLSPVVNLGWLAIALLAGWCVGRPFGVAPVTLSGVAALMATPGLVATQPGGAYDDVVGFALLLCCVAVLVTIASSDQDSRLPGLFIASLAAGLALGTKFTFLAPIGALTIGVWVLARRGRRLLEGSVWLLGVVVTGAFWYLRNLIEVGNPLPSLHIKVGPVALPSPAVGTPSTTFAHFVLNGSAWRQYFLPGMRLSFGPAWWALLSLAAAGLVFGVIAGPGRMPRMLAWVGLATAAAFVITPQYLAILGAPVYFVDNVRYIDPALGLGLVILPLTPILRGRGRAWWILGVYGAILTVTQLDGSIWPIKVLAQRFGPPIVGEDSLVGLGIGASVLGAGAILYFLLRRRPEWHPPSLAVMAISIACLASVFGLQQFYLRNRYTNSNPSTIFAWAQHVSNARIGVAGALTQIQYELYGKNLSNYVQYVAQAGPQGGYAPIASCSRWRQILNAGHYDYVLTSTGLVSRRRYVFHTPFSFTVWTLSDPASALVRREILAVPGHSGSVEYLGLSLFQLHGHLDPATCGSPVLRNVVPTQS